MDKWVAWQATELTAMGSRGVWRDKSFIFRTLFKPPYNRNGAKPQLKKPLLVGARGFEPPTT
jgi:hypothetical protein